MKGCKGTDRIFVRGYVDEIRKDTVIVRNDGGYFGTTWNEVTPSAQQERKKGKWIYYPKASGSVKSTALHLYPVCSECGCEHPVANYCPNCGANMKGEQDD